MNIYDKDFPVSRLLDDAIRDVEIVGFDPSEIKLSSKHGNFYPITSDNLATALAHDLNTPDFLSVMEGHTEKDYQDRGQITRYFWESLSSDVDGKKTWDNPADGLDPMLAVARAYAAITIRCDRDIAARMTEDEESRRRIDEASAARLPGRQRVAGFLDEHRQGDRSVKPQCPNVR